MKFSRGTRGSTCLFNNNYNPGPGSYLGNDNRYSEILKYSHPYNKGVPFGSECRFQGNFKCNMIPGPGSYNLKHQFLSQQEFIKKSQVNPNLVKTSYLKMFKVNAVPSIPSNHFQSGYQEIGEGLVIQLKDNSSALQQSRVGPGSYDPKFDTIRPRKQTTLIRRQSKFSNILRSTPRLDPIEMFVSQQGFVKKQVTQVKREI